MPDTKTTPLPRQPELRPTLEKSVTPSRHPSTPRIGCERDAGRSSDEWYGSRAATGRSGPPHTRVCNRSGPSASSWGWDWEPVE